MKLKTIQMKTMVLQDMRTVLLMLLLAMMFLSLFLIINVSTASASLGYAPECIGCHATEDEAFGSQPGQCGICHGTLPSTQGTNRHPLHLIQESGKGPAGMLCSTCHGVGTDNEQTYFSNPLHNNGTVNFVGGGNLAATSACNSCHSPGGTYNGVNSQDNGAGMSIGAKDNWVPGVYAGALLQTGKEKWCVGCHDVDSPTIWGGTGGTSQTAKNIAGDQTGYGYYKSGHGLDAVAKYDEDALDDATGTAGAGKKCTDCHDMATDHINDNNDSSTVGQRIKSSINGELVASVADACKACHSTTNGTPATVKVSGHGNATSTGGFNSPAEEPFSAACQQCHDPHSSQLNAESTRNLKMIRPDINVATGVFGDVVFKATTGVNSFDENDTEAGDPGTPQTISNANNADDACTTCHSNTNNSGYPATNHAGGYGHGGGAADYRAQNCTNCHKHNYNTDAVYQYDDGFMPGGAGACGGCHNANTATMKNGSHETHFTYPASGDPQSLKGPGLLTCDACHGVGAGAGSHAGHQNGTKNFVEGATTALGATGVCDTCHSATGGYNGVNNASGSVGGKDNWNYPTATFAGAVEPAENVGNHGVYDTTGSLRAGLEKWCAGCHDSVPSQIMVGETTSTSGTLMSAAPVGGDGSNYGAFINGHNKPSAKYDENALGDGLGNFAAGWTCATCHDLTTQHLSQADETDLAGQRIRGTINDIAITAVIDVCKACHQNSTGPEYANNQVSGHGNSGETYTKIESGTMTEIECARCHEGHGNNKNVNNNRNLKMIASKVKVTDSVATTVAYENRTGARSLDGSTTAATSVCRACHADSANNPGYPMTRHDGGDHATADTSSIFEGAPAADSDKRDEDCTTCHEHNYKGNASPANNANAFMPAFIQTKWPTQLSCDGACHKTTNTSMDMNSHTTHLSASSLKGPQIGLCDTCHGVGAISGTQEGHFVDGWANFPQ